MESAYYKTGEAMKLIFNLGVTFIFLKWESIYVQATHKYNTIPNVWIGALGGNIFDCMRPYFNNVHNLTNDFESIVKFCEELAGIKKL